MGSRGLLMAAPQLHAGTVSCCTRCGLGIDAEAEVDADSGVGLVDNPVLFARFVNHSVGGFSSGSCGFDGLALQHGCFPPRDARIHGMRCHRPAVRPGCRWVSQSLFAALAAV